jgi:hypothetical protein
MREASVSTCGGLFVTPKNMNEKIKNILYILLVVIIVFFVFIWYIEVDTCDKYPKPDCYERFTPILFHWLGWY